MQRIESTLDIASAGLSGEFRVAPAVDDTLTTLAERMEDLKGDMKAELSKVAAKLNVDAHKAIKLDSDAQNGFTFKISKKVTGRNRSLSVNLSICLLI